MRLAIVVVYLAGADDGPLLDLHLDRLRRHTTVPYTLYAGVDRLAPAFVERLRLEASAQMHTFGEVSQRGTLEHSHYLTRLSERALADGASHIAHLHMDSFPVREGWAEELARGLGSDWALAGVSATEIGERHRPRLCGALVPRAFHDTYGPVVSVDELPAADPAYEVYARRTVGPDSGDAYGYLLAKHGLPWRRLERSNAREDHYLLGGLYGDLFFHLGAATRTSRRFPPRNASPRQVQGLRHALRVGRTVVPPALRRFVPPTLLRPWNPDGSDTRRNNLAFARIRERLLADPDGYLAYLRGVT
jgi:hypothetical protein